MCLLHTKIDVSTYIKAYRIKIILSGYLIKVLTFTGTVFPIACMDKRIIEESWKITYKETAAGV